MSALTFTDMIRQSARYLEKNRRCSKHHVEHTGSNAYLLDFYDYLGELDKGKELVWYLLGLIVDSPEGAKVFYPGHLNPMNMSQNVIDTGTSVDAISRFALRNQEIFSDQEHARIKGVLKEVVETYLVKAARDKKVTNQRLWGLTGVASYAAYCGETEKYKKVAGESITRAFADMTTDGFFRYHPDAEPHYVQYDDITTFYQSRHIAFIYYSLKNLNMSADDYEEDIDRATNALLSMYDSAGIKDLRMECKRWYWLSSYEVASHSFDAHALAHSHNPIAKTALNNVLYQIKRHFFDGFMHSHKGINLDFQCPIFWTAHLAWVTRIENIEQTFNAIHSGEKFSFFFNGKEIITCTTPKNRVLINTRWHKRNPTAGIFDNGLSGEYFWTLTFPKMPHAYFFSIREVLNHSWYALRGWHVLEAVARLWRFFIDTIIMMLPSYCIKYGKITSIQRKGESFEVEVLPGSKYGTVLGKPHMVSVSLPHTDE